MSEKLVKGIDYFDIEISRKVTGKSTHDGDDYWVSGRRNSSVIWRPTMPLDGHMCSYTTINKAADSFT